MQLRESTYSVATLAYQNDNHADVLNDDRQVNVPLLRKTLEHITAHPEEWNQELWAQQTACGTAFCLAGHAVVSEGADIVWDPPCSCGCDEMPTANVCLTTDGELRTIDNYAMHQLGLSNYEADALFGAGNCLQTLWTIASSITEGEIEIPEDLD